MQSSHHHWTSKLELLFDHLMLETYHITINSIISMLIDVHINTIISNKTYQLYTCKWPTYYNLFESHIIIITNQNQTIMSYVLGNNQHIIIITNCNQNHNVINAWKQSTHHNYNHL